MEFKGRDVISIMDFSVEEIDTILDVAEKMVPIAEGKKKSRLLEGFIMSSLFFEPSTRTRLSFESAMSRLGGSVIGFSDPSGTSVKKGETLADTVRMAAGYSDAIVLRHNKEGAARLGAEFSDKPVLNAGDGAGQHPTQTLLDLFTMRQEKGGIGKNHVVFVGDLKYGRTVHSLAIALAMYGAEMTFVAPRQLQMPKEVINRVKSLGGSPHQSNSLEDVVGKADIVYVTRIQKERFPDPAEYIKVADMFRVDKELLEKAKKSVIIMHPLPRVNEISPEVDSTKHALYFKQAFNGVPVRMALLALTLGKEAKK